MARYYSYYSGLKDNCTKYEIEGKVLVTYTKQNKWFPYFESWKKFSELDLSNSVEVASVSTDKNDKAKIVLVQNQQKHTYYIYSNGAEFINRIKQIVINS